MSETQATSPALQALIDQEKIAAATGDAPKADASNQAADEVVVMSNAQAIEQAANFIRDGLLLIFKTKSVKYTLDDGACAKLGAAWGPVCDKRGFSISTALGDYSLEIFAVLGTASIFKAVYTGLSNDFAEQSVENTAPEKATKDAKSGDVVTTDQAGGLVVVGNVADGTKATPIDIKAKSKPISPAKSKKAMN